MTSRLAAGRSTPRSCSRSTGAQLISSSPLSTAITRPNSDRQDMPGPEAVPVSAARAVTDLRSGRRAWRHGSAPARADAEERGLAGAGLGAAGDPAGDPAQVGAGAVRAGALGGGMPLGVRK